MAGTQTTTNHAAAKRAIEEMIRHAVELRSVADDLMGHAAALHRKAQAALDALTEFPGEEVAA